MGSLETLVGAGLATSGYNRKDSRETRPYTLNMGKWKVNVGLGSEQGTINNQQLRRIA